LYLCHSRTNWREQFIDKLTKHLKDASTAADLRCIVEGSQKWFQTDDTNESDEPDEPDATTQLGWYQVIKGYLPNQWSITQENIFRDSTQDTIQANDGRANLLHSSGRKAIPFGKIGVHQQTPLPLTDKAT
jgi:hypothetical protein